MFFIQSLHGSFFSNRVNSWLMDRKKRTGLKMITIPKPLKQYTLLKKTIHSASSPTYFRKNLSTPGAIHFQKANFLR